MITALTAVGGRSENQDHFLYAEDTSIGLVAVVCDGMGGMAGGQEASQLATRTILEGLQHLNADADIPGGITAAVQHANERIYEAAGANPDLKGMGTTVVVLVLNEQRAYLGHVGDSRIYQIRKGKTLFRTWDHSTVFKMLEEGILKSEEEARNHERSNQLLRAVGVSPAVEVEVNVCEYRKGDLFLLCSDGICGELGDDLILEEFRKGLPLPDIANGLMGLADQIGELSGGTHDNMTVLLVAAEKDGKAKTRSGPSSGGRKSSPWHPKLWVLPAVLILFFGLAAGAHEFVRVVPMKEQVALEKGQRQESENEKEILEREMLTLHAEIDSMEKALLAERKMNKEDELELQAYKNVHRSFSPFVRNLVSNWLKAEKSALKKKSAQADPDEIAGDTEKKEELNLAGKGMEKEENRKGKDVASGTETEQERNDSDLMEEEKKSNQENPEAELPDSDSPDEDKGSSED